MNRLKESRLFYLLIVLGLGVILFPFIVTTPFILHTAIILFLFAFLGEAWALIGGYAALFSFGQAAFFGIGAYTSTLLVSSSLHLSPWLGMITGGLFAALVGAGLAYPCSKIKGHYFAVASMAFAETLRIIFNNWELVGAARGLEIPILPESFLNFEFHSSKLPYYYIMLGMLAGCLVLLHRIRQTRFGFYLVALRDSEKASETLGINTKRYKVYAVALSAFLTAIGGSFYAQYILYIDPPSTMTMKVSMEIVLTTMVGGVASIWGPLIGAVILVPLSELFRVIWGGKGMGIDLMVYGILIMLFAVLKPEGVVSFFKFFRLKPQGN